MRGIACLHALFGNRRNRQERQDDQEPPRRRAMPSGKRADVWLRGICFCADHYIHPKSCRIQCQRRPPVPRHLGTLMLEGGFHAYGSMTGRKNNMRSGIVLVYPTTPSTVAVKTDPGTVNQTPEGKLEEACTP